MNTTNQLETEPISDRDYDKGQRVSLIRSLLEHAATDIRLAEFMAIDESLWHLAEDCRSLRSAIEKLTSTKLEGE